MAILIEAFGMPEFPGIYLIIALLLVACYTSISVILHRFYSKPLPLPVLNTRKFNHASTQEFYLANLRVLLEDGYSKFKDSIYQLWTPVGYQVVLPRKFINELKGYEELSFSHYVQDDQIGLYNWFDLASLTVAHVVKHRLSPQLGALLPLMAEEARFAIPEIFPKSKEWKPVKINDALLRTTAIISNRMLAGPEVSRNEDWIMLQLDFAKEFVAAASQLLQYPIPLRPLITPFLASVRQTWKYQATMVSFLEEYKLKTEAAVKGGAPPPNTLAQWLAEEHNDGDKQASVQHQANLMLITGLDCIYTVSQLCTQTLYDLAARPEYIQPLREEILSLWPRGQLLPQGNTFRSMVKLESFLRESQRIHPVSLTAFQRKALRPVTLSDGTTLPTGTLFFVPNCAYSTDPSAWESPSTFKGFRHISSSTDNTTSSQAQSQSKEATDSQQHGQHFGVPHLRELTFGIGRHACPGRFYAVAEIKMVLAMLIRDYDVKLVEGKTEAPKATADGWLVFVDESEELLFRNVVPN